MNKKYFLYAAVLVLLSCNSASDKKGTPKEDEGKVSSQKNEYSSLVNDLNPSTDMFNILCQGWEHEDDLASLKDMSGDSKLEIPFRSFYFFPDGTFLKDPRNTMDFGKWVYDNSAKTITLKYTVEKGQDIYKIAALSADELKVVNKGLSSNTVLKFIGSGKSFIRPADDPYYISNNQWRIKPAKKETDAEIQKRLQDNLHFFVLYYRSALAKDAKVVSTWGFPTCLKLYGGGIYITKKDELNDIWIQCFYNRDQAMKAYEIMDKVMDKKYSWPKGETNWIKQNLAVLEQMEKNVAAYK